MSITNKVSDMIYSLKEDMKDSTFKQLMDKLKDINIQEEKTEIVKFQLTYLETEQVIHYDSEGPGSGETRLKKILISSKCPRCRKIVAYCNREKYNLARGRLYEYMEKDNVVDNYNLFSTLGLFNLIFPTTTEVVKLNIPEGNILIEDDKYDEELITYIRYERYQRHIIVLDEIPKNI